jgi:hypothetical protein
MRIHVSCKAADSMQPSSYEARNSQFAIRKSLNPSVVQRYVNMVSPTAKPLGPLKLRKENYSSSAFQPLCVAELCSLLRTHLALGKHCEMQCISL